MVCHRTERISVTSGPPWTLPLEGRRCAMHRASFVVVMGLMGCATTGRPPVDSTAPDAPATVTRTVTRTASTVKKNEIVVIGKGWERLLPGEVSISPAQQGTEFVIHNKHVFRCTKVTPPPRDPEKSEYCRDVTIGQGRNPDMGQTHRAGVY